jgi:microcompartment protein CcmL/EutN
MATKKIEVEMDGRIIKIHPAMLERAKQMGAVIVGKTVRPMPKELIKAVIKKVEPLPEMKITEQVNEIAEMEITEPEVIEAPKRKPPVRSKATK